MAIGNKKKLSFKLVLDASSIEIFINGGQYVMTNQLFPNEAFTHFEILPKENVKVSNFNMQFINKSM